MEKVRASLFLFFCYVHCFAKQTTKNKHPPIATKIIFEYYKLQEIRTNAFFVKPKTNLKTKKVELLNLLSVGFGIFVTRSKFGVNIAIIVNMCFNSSFLIAYKGI